MYYARIIFVSFLAVVAFNLGAQNLNYKYRGVTYTSHEDAFDALRNFRGDTGQFYELYNTTTANNITNYIYAVRLYPIADDHLAWQPHPGFPVPGGGVTAPCEFQGDAVPGFENHCNSLQEYIDKQTLTLANISGNCGVPTPIVEQRPGLYYTNVSLNPEIRNYYATASTPAASIAEIINYTGRYTKLWQDDCEPNDYIELEPVQNCLPGECLPSRTILESRVGICPVGLTLVLSAQNNYFGNGATPKYPDICGSSQLETIQVIPSSTSITDTPVVQQCSDQVGNPCNVVNGDKSISEAVFEIPGLNFKLSYHSISEMPSYSMLGRGWRHNFDSIIMDNGVSPWSKTIVLPNGKIAIFTIDPNDSNVYYPQFKSGEILKRKDSNTYLYQMGDGREFEYTKNSNGSRYFLTAIINLHDGGRIDVERDNNYIVKSINLNTGRKIDFGYDGQKLINVSQGALSLAVFSYTDISPVEKKLDSIQYADGKTRSYLYADNDFPYHVTTIVDENTDQYATYSYDDFGKVEVSEHANGAGRVSLNYGVGQTTVTMPLGSTRIYNVSKPSSAQLLRTDSIIEDGLTTTYTYSSDQAWLPETQTDRNSNQSLYGYDEWNRVESQTDGFGTPEASTVETDWNDVYNRPDEIRYRNLALVVTKQVNFAYNLRGQVLTRTVTDPGTSNTRVTTYTYFESPSESELIGRINTIDGPRMLVNDVTTFTYYTVDSTSGDYLVGDLHTVTNAEGHITEYLKYDAAGRPLEIEDSNNVVTVLTYHPRGWLTSTATVGETINYAYDDVGNLERITQQDGSFIDYGYDAAHRLTDINDSMGNSVTYTLDIAGNRTAEEYKDPLTTIRRSLSRVYDQLGRLDMLLDSANVPTDFDYDDNGNQTEIDDPVGRISRYEYDALDRLVKAIDAVLTVDERDTVYDYDHRHNLISVTDPLGHITTYTYDGLEDLKELNSPGTGITQYQYDSAGNRIQQVDARGVVTDYTYDKLNRLKTIEYPSDTSFDVTFTYDVGGNGKGRLTGMTDLSGGTSWAYDELGRITSKTQTVGGVSFTLQYTYNSSGQLATMVYPSGKQLVYAYNLASQLVSIQFGDPGNEISVVNNVTYLPFGPVSNIDYGGSVTDQQRLYDQDYDTAGFSGALQRTYTTNAAGEITNIAPNSGAQWEYDYDNLARLSGAESPPGQTSGFWNYDENGNLTANAAMSYTIDTNSNRISGGFQLFYNYDAMGNTTGITQGGIGVKSMTYGPNQRLVNITNTDTNLEGDYIHNGRGERVSKTVSPLAFGGGLPVTTLFVYGQNGELLGEYDANGNLVAEYHWLGNLLVGLNKGGDLNRVYTDHLGTPRAVVDKSGDAIWEWDSLSRPHGYSYADEDPDNNNVNLILNLRFPGQYYDLESGFFYNYYRNYDPETGRYIESDPIGLTGGMNTYLYVNANPNSFIDPYGQQVAVPLPLPGLGVGAGASASAAGPVAAAGALGIGIGTLIHSTFETQIADIVDSIAEFCLPECNPPKGTVCYIIDFVPPSKPHYPIPGSHYHLWVVNQNPKTGECFWNKLGVSRAAPPGAIPCAFERPSR